MGRGCRARWGCCEDSGFCPEIGDPGQMCVYLTAVERAASCLPHPHQKGTPVSSTQCDQHPCAQSSHLPALKPVPPTPLPPHPPPPHLLAGAHHRGPAGSRGAAGSRQTAFSKNCQRVAGCSQAHPQGTCSRDIATLTHWCVWTSSVRPGKHPSDHVHLHTHTHTPSMSTHSGAHSKAQMYPPNLNTTGPCIPLAHTLNTHAHTEHSYVPDTQVANGT